MVDSDVKVACQQACPTHAISFGNANDKHSAITMVRAENPNRNFTVLEQLHVLPNVTYLAKVRNDSAKAEGHKAEATGHEAKAEGHKAETKKAEAAH
jgi:molybdopterin-containing oxidoreductase family iron-sulfur binding subunit